jgi:hypothetical protein
MEWKIGLEVLLHPCREAELSFAMVILIGTVI